MCLISFTIFTDDIFLLLNLEACWCTGSAFTPPVKITNRKQISETCVINNGTEILFYFLICLLMLHFQLDLYLTSI